MGGFWTGCRGALLPAIPFLAACQGTAVSGGTNGSGVAASSAGSSTGAASSTGGIAPTSSSGATGGATSGGSGTSAQRAVVPAPAPAIRSSTAATSFARRPGAGGPVSWMCQPGTYFCDPGGDGGNCFRCRTDADCANRALPTYDPARPRCDLDSGVGGHQNFCQQCLDDADCSANQAGPDCDLELTDPFPPYGTTLRAPIVTSGFEACGRIEIDCRVDGGPDCGSLVDGVCDQATGACATRPADCTSDADCAGYQAYFGFGEEGLAPFCVDGGCSPCGDAGNCPEDYSSPGTTCPGGEPAAATARTMAAGVRGVLANVREFPPPRMAGSWARLPTHLGSVAAIATSSVATAAWPASPPASALEPVRDRILRPVVPGAECRPLHGDRSQQANLRLAHRGVCRACVTDGECAADPNSGGVNCGNYERSCYCVLDSDCPAGRHLSALPWRPVHHARRRLPGSCLPASAEGAVACMGSATWDSGEVRERLPSVPGGRRLRARRVLPR